METFLENLVTGINAVDTPISPESKLSTLPHWDSLAILTTISMIDMEYGVTVSGTDLSNCDTVADLYNLVMNRKG